MSRAFAPVGRPTAASEIAPRRAWLSLIETAADIANRVRKGHAIDRGEAAAFAGLVIRMRAPFPLRYASAQNAAEAFLTLARGFVASGQPATTAGFLAEGAACLDAMLTADGHAAAAEARRRMGEVD